MDIIIGAGISGIAYANFTKSEYLILEADSEIGGYCKTIKQDGFTWDYSGHFFHFQNKWLEDFICKNIDVNTILTCNKHTQINYNGTYVDFPFQKNIHQLPKDEFIECLVDLFDIKDVDYKTFKQMLYAKFGKSITRKFLIPYNEKLYACNLDLLDVDAMGRFFPYADRNEIILNFKKKDNQSYNSFFTYPRGGAIEYVNSLYKNIDLNTVFFNEKVIEIDPKNKIVVTSKRSIKYNNIISTIPFPQLLEITKTKYDKSIYSWNKVLVFNLGFDKKGDDKVNNWVYFPSKELCFYRIGYYDNIFADDRMSLYVELGFDEKYLNIDIVEYKEKVLKDLKKMGIITNQNLVSSHYIIMNPAYVHITETSILDVERKKNILKKNNIYSIGRYGSWCYCSIEDNILEAKRLSEII